MADALKGFRDWEIDVKTRRTEAAHRMPLYVPSGAQGPDSQPVADSGRDADGCEEVDGVSVVSRADASEFLDTAEHALDGVSVAVEHGRKAVLPAAVRLGRGVRHGAVFLDLSADGVAVVALVTMQDANSRHPLQQGRTCRAIGNLAAGEQVRDGPAVAVGQRVDFGRAAAARASDGLVPLPPYGWPAPHRVALLGLQLGSYEEGADSCKSQCLALIWARTAAALSG